MNTPRSSQHTSNNGNDDLRAELRATPRPSSRNRNTRDTPRPSQRTSFHNDNQRIVAPPGRTRRVIDRRSTRDTQSPPSSQQHQQQQQARSNHLMYTNNNTNNSNNDSRDTEIVTPIRKKRARSPPIQQQQQQMTSSSDMQSTKRARFVSPLAPGSTFAPRPTPFISSTIGTTPPIMTTQRPLCRFFPRCAKGASCPFLHPLGSMQDAGRPTTTTTTTMSARGPHISDRTFALDVVDDINVNSNNEQ